jgi:diacylglycerol kinase (ATP)
MHLHILNYMYILFPDIIKVYDGNSSFRRRIFRLICVSRQSTTEELLTAALREFRITKDPGELLYP